MIRNNVPVVMTIVYSQYMTMLSVPVYGRCMLLKEKLSYLLFKSTI